MRDGAVDRNLLSRAYAARLFMAAHAPRRAARCRRERAQYAR